MHVRRSIVAVVFLLFAVFTPPRAAFGYSVLTHEQLIDLTWDASIVPLLKSRYPTLTPEQIEHARAYAYGGCVIQDIGYYPFGDPAFSNLTHYVRTGDFVVNLFRNAGNADELAFAIGALSHYIGDTVGHSEATNRAVPVEFPKLQKKYGDSVNYAEGEHEHVQTEFAFDIYEIVHHRFAPVHYLRHVGLQVPVRQVALAFYQTYGIREDFEGRRGKRMNVRGYRFAVRNFIPRIAYAVTVLHRNHEPVELQSPDLLRLQAEVTAVAAKNDWDAYRKKAGIGTYMLAGFIYILPKVGPLKLVSVKGPTQETEQEYVHAVVKSSDMLNHALRRFTPPPARVATASDAARNDPGADSPPAVRTVPNPAVSSPRLVSADDRLHPLVNRDLDTGNPVKPSGYRLTDDTYAYLLHRLVQTPKDPVPPVIKQDILNYYADMSLPFATKKHPEKWAQVQSDLAIFRGMATSRELDPFATYDDGDDGNK